MGVPIISTDVGVASEVLHETSIFKPSHVFGKLGVAAASVSVTNATVHALSSQNKDYAYNAVQQYFFEPSFKWFRALLGSLV